MTAPILTQFALGSQSSKAESSQSIDWRAFHSRQPVPWTISSTATVAQARLAVIPTVAINVGEPPWK